MQGLQRMLQIDGEQASVPSGESCQAGNMTGAEALRWERLRLD